MYSLLALVLFFSASSFAAEVLTDAPNYLIGTIVDIDGLAFGTDEFVTMQVTELDGTPIAGASGMPWSVSSDALGGFVTTWLVDYQGTSSELLLTAIGQTSGETATTTFVAGTTNLDQLQNGAGASAPKWANGNINSNNSCYSEGRAVPYRAFITDQGAGTDHFFTIEMEWTKGTVHAFDFLASYDFSEDSAITLAGGPCGNVGTSSPGDCVDPTDSLVLPSPDSASNYSGSIPGDFYPGTYQYNDTNYLMAYNAVIDSVGDYYFGGTSSDRTWSVEVYYTQVGAGTVGFYWGGNLSEGDPNHWGYGNGSASVGGAPYHMRMKYFDGGGGANQDRSIQNGTICLPPQASILIDADSLCFDTNTTYTAYDTSGANEWLWRITNGTIDGDSTLSSVEFSVDGAGTVTVELMACNTDGGCPGDFCCADVSVTLPTKSCNTPPEVYCAAPDTMFVCDLSDICISGFTSYDADGDGLTCSVSSGTLSGDTVCFTPVEGANTITYICSDPSGAADTCETMIYVELNSPPVASCPGDGDTTFVCDLSDICIDGFTTSDPDNNIASVVVTGGTLSGGTVCFTPSVGANTITLIVTDACGEADTCQTTVMVRLNSAPVASCPGDDSLFVCDLSEICIDGFTTSDTDYNIASVVVTGGTLSGDTVCLTPSVGANTITLIATDACGAADTCQMTITVGLNSAPVVSCPPSDTLFVCDLSDICADGFSSSDVDGNLANCTVSLGTLTGTEVCFTPAAGANTITYICTDSCDLADTCETVITVVLNSPPVVSCPPSDTLFVCDLSDICADGFSSSDVDGNLANCTVSLGTLTGTEVCFTPVEGANTITYICTDSCDLADTCETTIYVELNSPPVATCPAGDTVFLCELPPTYCVDGFGCDDPDGHAVTSTINGAPFGGGQYCFTPVAGNNYLQLICVDTCGVADTCETLIHIDLNSAPICGDCPAGDTLLVCDLSEICMSGFNPCDDPDGNLDYCYVTGGTLTGTTVCFTPVEGDNTILFICVDSCDLADTCETVIRVELIPGPTASCPPSDTLFLCELPPTYCLDGFGCDNSVSSTINGVPFGGGQYCFTPMEGDNYLELICVDTCGVADTCETLIRIDLNSPPVATCPAGDTVFLCELPPTYCVDGFGCDDPDGNVVSSTINGVPFGGGQYCFTPVAGDNYLQLICVDSCGLADTCETVIRVELIPGPTASCPPSDTLFLCELPPTYCLDGFGCDNSVSSTINGVPFGGGQYCFTPVAGDNYLQLICVDSCGVADTCETLIHIDLNSAPVATCPAGDTVFLCELPPTYCLDGFGCDDPDGHAVTSTINGAPFGGGQYCFTPVAGNNYLQLICVDTCGVADTCETLIHIDLNSAPDVTCPPGVAVTTCTFADTVCVGEFEATDLDGNLMTTLLNGQPYTPGGQYCFAPDSGINLLIFTAIDSCGASATCTTMVEVEALPVEDCDLCPSFTIEKTHGTLQGQHQYVTVTVDSSEIEMGGYDLLIAYDASALNLQAVIPGPPFYDPPPDGCGWEYFIYRQGPCGSCAGSCPSGMVRVFGLAETNNGPNHPACFMPDSLPATLFSLDFLITNDRTFECQYVPVNFFWCDCADNTVSSVDGNILYMDLAIYDFEDNLLWDEDDDDQFPEDDRIPHVGAPDYCLVPDPGKPIPQRCLIFKNGGVDIVCADSIDDRGDINLNGVANEVADAVLFSNYFVHGISVFNVNIDGQIAASDVNADGITLSVADLVYLIRVITGDAVPYFKQAPIVIATNLADGVLSVDASLGAAWLMVAGEQQPVLLAVNMEMKYGYNANEDLTRILVYSLEKDHTFEGAFLAGLEGEVVKFEGATYEGIPVTAKLVPEQFALYPSYPNPFNPVTTIAFALAEATDYELTIYNALGREVQTFRGHGTPGIVEVQWDAGGHASGIYLYRLKAGTYTETRKMVLLK